MPGSGGGAMGASSFPSQHSREFDDLDVFGSLRRRLIASIAGAVAWISFTLLYLAFWAHGFSWFQSVVVLIVSLVVLTGVLLGTWVSYGFAFLRRGFD